MTEKETKIGRKTQQEASAQEKPQEKIGRDGETAGTCRFRRH